jgi:hypothetical protein
VWFCALSLFRERAEIRSTQRRAANFSNHLPLSAAIWSFLRLSFAAF